MLTPNEYHQLLREDLVSFTERAFAELNPQTDLLMSDYIEAIIAKLEACRRGEITRLIINLPPRYLKSHCVSVAFVAYLLGHQPAAQVICASYGQDLAEKLARDCRNVMSSSWYQRIFSTRLSPDKQAVNDFMTTENGFRMATSVGGVLTGRGADYILIDDPIKPEDALSDTRRQSVNDWFDNTLLSRLNNKTKGCIILIMQRLHQDDLAGHVFEQGNWDVLSFPAIAEQDETHVIQTPMGVHHYHRRAGEALHPEREPLSALQTIRKTIGEYNFTSQYQQNPAPQGGAIIKREWLRYLDPAEFPGSYESVVQSWDTANKAGEFNDFSVCTTWGIKDGRYYLIHVHRRKYEYPDLKRAVHEQACIYKPSTILIEDKASGTQLIQELTQENLAGVTAYSPNGYEKQVRLHSQSAAFESGLIILPSAASWLEDYVHELTTCPGCKYYDQIDSTTQALEHMRKPQPWAGLMEYYRHEAEKVQQGNGYHSRGYN